MFIKFKIIYKEGISTPQVPLHEEHDPPLPHLFLIPSTYYKKNTILRELEAYTSGPSCSKLTMSLVNVSLKVWSLNMTYYANIFAEKCE